MFLVFNTKFVTDSYIFEEEEEAKNKVEQLNKENYVGWKYIKLK